MAAPNPQLPAGSGPRNQNIVPKKEDEELDAFAIERERLARECKVIEEKYLKEEAIRFKKYEADTRRELIETYFSDKDIFGGTNMASIPSLFGRSKSSSKRGATSTGAPSIVMPEPLAKPPQGQFASSTKEPLPKRQRKPANKGAKQACDMSEVYNYFGGMAEGAVSDEEFKAWKSRNEEDRESWISKSSFEMMFHVFERDAAKDAEITHLKEKEAEWKKEVDKMKSKMKKAVDAKDAANAEKARLDGLVFEKDNRISQLESSLSKLKLENQALKDDQANGWAVEKERIIDASFEDGVNSCIATFVAGDPEYDWAPKFGKGIASYITDFPKKHTDLMAEKKKELADMLAGEAKASRLDEDGAALQPQHKT